MTDIDTADLRAGATNIHSIGPDRAAGLLTAAADAIDALRRDFAEARQLASRYGIELGPHFAAHGTEARRLLRIANDPTIHVVGEERGCQPGTCLATPPCRNRAEMRANHGTPDEFELAIMRAAPELSVAEADRAVTGYRAAWEAASGPDTTPRPSRAQVPRFEGFMRTCLLSWSDTKCSGTHVDQLVPDLSPPIGAPTLAIAEQFDVEASAAAEEPGTPGDGQGIDLWPGSGLPPLMSATTIGALRRFAPEPGPAYEASCAACEGEQFEGAICNACGDHVELAANGDGTFRRVYHSPAQIEQFEQAERSQGLDDSDRE